MAAARARTFIIIHTNKITHCHFCVNYENFTIRNEHVLRALTKITFRKQISYKLCSLCNQFRA